MSDRLQREIEDIVDKAGKLPPPPRGARGAPKSRSTPPPPRGRFSIGGMRQAAIAGLILLIVGALLWGAAGSIGAALVLGGLLLLGAAYLSYFRNGGAPGVLPGGYEKRWRGQTVYDNPDSPSLLTRLRQWRKRRH